MVMVCIREVFILCYCNKCICVKMVLCVMWLRVWMVWVFCVLCGWVWVCCWLGWLLLMVYVGMCCCWLWGWFVFWVVCGFFWDCLVVCCLVVGLVWCWVVVGWVILVVWVWLCDWVCVVWLFCVMDVIVGVVFFLLFVGWICMGLVLLIWFVGIGGCWLLWSWWVLIGCVLVVIGVVFCWGCEFGVCVWLCFCCWDGMWVYSLNWLVLWLCCFCWWFLLFVWLGVVVDYLDEFWRIGIWGYVKREKLDVCIGNVGGLKLFGVRVSVFRLVLGWVVMVVGCWVWCGFCWVYGNLSCVIFWSWSGVLCLCICGIGWVCGCLWWFWLCGCWDWWICWRMCWIWLVYSDSGLGVWLLFCCLLCGFSWLCWIGMFSDVGWSWVCCCWVGGWICLMLIWYGCF